MFRDNLEEEMMRADEDAAVTAASDATISVMEASFNAKRQCQDAISSRV